LHSVDDDLTHTFEPTDTDGRAPAWYEYRLHYSGSYSVTFSAVSGERELGCRTSFGYTGGS
jgi:hypothetical protein